MGKASNMEKGDTTAPVARYVKMLKLAIGIKRTCILVIFTQCIDFVKICREAQFAIYIFNLLEK